MHARQGRVSLTRRIDRAMRAIRRRATSRSLGRVSLAQRFGARLKLYLARQVGVRVSSLFVHGCFAYCRRDQLGYCFRRE